MKNKKYKTALFIFSFILCLMLTGCWDSHELNDLTIVLGIGIDKDPTSAGVEVTLQSQKPSPTKASGGGSEAEPSFMIKRSGSTIVDVYNTFTQYHSRKMFFPDNYVIVFSEELAKEGIADYLDFFLRDYETRPDTSIMITRGKAYDILNTKTVLEKVPSINLFKSILKQDENSMCMNSELLKFIVKTHSPTTAATAPIVESIKDEIKERIKFNGMAVFKKDKMVGILNKNNSRGLLYVLGEVNRTSIMIDIPNGKAEIIIISPTSNIKPHLDSSGKMSIDINISQKGVVEEISGFSNQKTKEILQLLEKESSDFIKEEILSSIRKAKELNCDYFGFGELFYKKYPKQWKTIEPQWDTFFPHLKVTVNVESVIRGNGKIPIIYDQKGRHLGE